jgi:peptidyl-prolyl cis-trans isomerase C
MIHNSYIEDPKMNSFFGSRLSGTRLVAISLSATVLLAASTVSAQEPKAAAPFDQAVLDLLLQSRIQKPASQATSQERAAAIEELTNIYVISSLPRAIELGETPEIRAQIELQERATLFNALATDFIASNPATEQEIFNTYEEQVALSPPKEFKARHILVDTQGEAMALVEELKGGADFVELAKEHSTGPSAPAGGDLGWFTAQAMVEPFSNAVAAMENGAFTPEPVQTQFGWHVILREDSRDSAPPPLDSVRDVIKQRVEQNKFEEFMNNARANASE